MAHLHCRYSCKKFIPVHTRHVAHSFHKPLKKKLEWLQKQDIIIQLGADETAEWNKNFVLVPKPNGKFRLCLDPARLNQALIQPVHRCPTLNDIIPQVTNVKYLPLIVASCRYHNLRLDEQLSYLATFVPIWQIQMTSICSSHCRQHVSVKNRQHIQSYPMCLDLLMTCYVVGYDNYGRDNEYTLRRVLLTCQKVNLKLNKDKCFRYSPVPFLGEIISSHGVRPNPRK